MSRELSRQVVHLSGILFVILLFYIPAGLVSLYSFVLSLGLLVYAAYLRLERNRLLRLLERIESPFRKALLHFEYRQEQSPMFAGAFWFFFSLGLAALIFPLPIAAAAMWMLSVGDVFSTLVGKGCGKRKVIGKKTLEGSLAMFFSCLTAVIFLPILPVILGSVVAVLAELLPEYKGLQKPRTKGIIDDNLLIPLAAGIVMWLVLLAM